jgi:hypothetical protein
MKILTSLRQTRPMKTKLYSEYVDVSEELDKQLKRCFINHLVIYNYSLEQLLASPELNFKKLTKIVTEYVNSSKLTPVIDTAYMNELYYQYKKFKRNIRVQKKLTDIQYFTFITKQYKSKSIKYDTTENRIHVTELSGYIQLTEPLPRLNQDDIIYLNLSYSNNEDRYRISIYLSSG